MINSEIGTSRPGGLNAPLFGVTSNDNHMNTMNDQSDPLLPTKVNESGPMT